MAQEQWVDVDEVQEDDVWEDVSSLNPPKSIKPETTKFAKSVSPNKMIGDSIYGREPEKEPETWWGGFRKSISDELGEAFSAKNPMLQSAARPETLSDFSNLILPSGIPNLRRLLPKQLIGKSGLSKVGKSVVEPSVIPDDIIPPVKPKITDELIPEQGLARIEPEIPHQVIDDIVERGGVQYKKTGINPDTGQPTYEPIPEVVGEPDIYDLTDTPVPDEMRNVGPQISEADDIARLGAAKDITPIQTGQEPLDWKNDPQKAANMMVAKANRIKKEVLEGKPVPPVEIKKTIPQDEIPKMMDEASDELDFIKSSPDVPPEIVESTYEKIRNTQRALLTGFDVSFIGRQGRGLITHKGYWSGLKNLYKSLGSKEADDILTQAIIDHPSGYFKSNVDELTGKVTPSFAEKVGLDLTNITKKGEENLRSNWAETGGNIPFFSKGYRETAGRVFKVSARANTAFINKARSDVFVSLIDELKNRGVNPELDLVTSKQIANSVNVSTGRGSFGKLEYPSFNTSTKKMEKSASMKALNEIFFAPKFMKSRFDMYNRALNPIKMYNADPIVRKEAIRSIIGVVGTGMLIQELARAGGAIVINDPTNPDFRKIKIGDTRIDNFAGLGQYGVATAQFLMGKSTSSVTGRTTDLTAGKYGQRTRADVAANFAVNRLAPIPSLLVAWMRGRDFDGKSFEWKKALANRTVPLVMQDLYDLQQEDPSLIPLGILPIVGEGIQTYSR